MLILFTFIRLSAKSKTTLVATSDVNRLMIIPRLSDTAKPLTGPVKGFAVSLSLGVIINLFTSLVGTRVIFDIFLHKGTVKKMSI